MSFKNKHHSNEAKQKISAAAKRSGEKNGNNGNTFSGHYHSAETKAKIGANTKKILTGKSLPSIQKQHISKSLIGKTYLNRKVSDDGKKRLSKSRIKFWEPLTDEERQKRTNHLTQQSAKFQGTKPECIFEEILINNNIQFEKQKWIKRYKVDFYLPERNLIVEIQGCYFHGCEQCGHNSEKQLQARDNDNSRKLNLEKLGYQVKFIWEHELV